MSLDSWLASRWTRATAIAVSAVLSITLLEGTAAAVDASGSAAAAAATASPAATPVGERVSSRPDLVSAALAARNQGSRVEVEALRTELSSTWANPDGSLTEESHGGPVRYRDAAGEWAPVELTMVVAADGSAAPKSHPLGLRLPGGSSSTPVAGAAAGAVKGLASAAASSGSSSSGAGVETDAVTIGAGAGRGVTLAWPGKLPTPTAEGTRATYADVTPGVDLVVEALRTGYEQFFVVKDRTALATGTGTGAAAEGVSWTLPLKTQGLSARPEADGSISFVDAKGTVASAIPPARAWDAKVDPASGEPASPSPVRMSVAQQSKGRALLTLTPDPAWLADPARQFPITVDPTYQGGSLAAGFDTFVQSNITSTDQSTSLELKVGTYDGGATKARSYLNFAISGIKGKQIQSAYLSLHETWSASCSARAVDVYNSGAASTATRWGSQPAIGTKQGTLNVARGYSSACAEGWVNIPILALARTWAANADAQGSVLVRAADETDSLAWKRFASSETATDPYVSVTWNRAPAVPAVPAPTSAAKAGDGNWYVNTRSPSLSTVSTDPDASRVKYNLQVFNSTTTGADTLVASCTTALVASAGRGACTSSPALVDSKRYWVRAQAVDELGLKSTWSELGAFRVGATPAAAPSISCTGYANGSWTDTPPASTVPCTITATPVTSTNYNGATKLLVSLDGAAEQATVVNPGITPSVTVQVPRTSGGHAVRARAVNPAGLGSAFTGYSFGYGQASLSSPAAGAVSTNRFRVIGNAQPRGSATKVEARVRYRAAGSGGDASTGWSSDEASLLDVTPAGSTTPITATTLWDATAAAKAVSGSERLPALLDVQLCFTYTYPSSSSTQCTWSQSPRTVQFLPHAFGNGFPTDEAGPGQVALWTGEFNTDATDVSVPGYSGDLSLSRSHSTFNGPNDLVTGVFGPGWTAQLEGAEDGAAGLQVIDGTRIDGTVALLDSDGSALVYRQPGNTKVQSKIGTYTPVDEDTLFSGSTLALAGTGTAMTLRLTDEDGTVTTWTPAKVGTPDTSTAKGTNTVWAPASVDEPGAVGATTYGRDTTGRITRILAPVAPGVTCPATGTLNPGCRALRIEYATATTATATAAGDVAGQVKAVWLDIYRPAEGATAAGMGAVKVAEYAYASSKRLARVTDPRSGLGTSYGYDALDRLTSIASAGLAAHRFTYTTTDSATANPGRDPGKLQRVTRDPAVAGGAVSVEASVVYGVPLSGAGLPDLRSDEDNASTVGVEVWGQAKAPTYAAAVFGPEHPVSGASGTGTGAPSSADWEWADLQYTDALGFTVNTAGYGAGDWRVTATDYDDSGNVVRELDSGAIAQVSAQSAAAGGGPVDADPYATVTRYNADIKNTAGAVLTPAGTLVTDEWGPQRLAVVPDPGSTTPGATTVDLVRPHTRTSYDQGAPNSGINPATGAPYRLPTQVTVGAAAADSATTDPAVTVPADLQTLSVTTNSYDLVAGAVLPDGSAQGNGWALGAPTRTATAVGSGESELVRVSVYDAEGRVVETRQPKAAAGGTAGTSINIPYRAGTGSGDARCDSKPAWAGLACVNKPAAAPTSGPTVPETFTAAYSYLLAPTQVVETSGAVTRTTTTTYLADGRSDTEDTTVAGLASSTAQPKTKTVYEPATGLATKTQTLDGAGTVTGTISTGYDLWGRATAYTDQNAKTTTTRYVAPGAAGAGQVDTVTDPGGTTLSRYGYGSDADGKAEHRGLPTSLVTPAGTYTAAYDADGGMTRQDMPGGISQRTEYDDAGEPVGLTYRGRTTTTTTDETGTTTSTVEVGDWLAWSQQNDVLGRVARTWTPAGLAFTGVDSDTDGTNDDGTTDVGDARSYDRAYTYDQAGRLRTVADRTATSGALEPDTAASPTAPCQVRSYAFDVNDNRTNMAVDEHADGNCAGTPTSSTSRTWAHDTADRNTTAPGGAAYAYDQLGRTLTIPAADTPRVADGTMTAAAAGNITLGYYDDDSARSITQAGASTTYQLDAAGRRATSTTTTPANTGAGAAATTRTLQRTYTDTEDNPSTSTDTLTTAAGSTPASSTVTTTRYTESLGGDLAAATTSTSVDGAAAEIAVQLTLADLHGDIVTTTTLPNADTLAATVDGWNDYTEYGTPRPGTPAAPNTPAGSLGYGWLGAKQRSTTETGLLLMGARLYNPATGRFTSPDPVSGGSPSRYAYPTDPVNRLDLNGQWWSWAARGAAAGGRYAWRGARYAARKCKWCQRQAVKHYTKRYNKWYGPSGRLFGDGKAGNRKGWFNRGPVRTGWGWKGSRANGRHVFRTAWGWPRHRAKGRSGWVKRRFPHGHRDWTR